jgi:hypothetical protein
VLVRLARDTGRGTGRRERVTEYVSRVSGNLVGGIGLVTSIRLLQAPRRVAEERTGNAEA